MSNRLDEIMDKVEDNEIQLQIAVAAFDRIDQISDEVKVDMLFAEVGMSLTEVYNLIDSITSRLNLERDRADQQLTEIAGAVSRIELHGKRKRFFGLF
ncbi:hypothetical protein [Paenibacillus sp. 203]|uniref:hypothetical protein n=1 Tax=Paenibacillus sp. 203 TaxID=3096765 RepID=UPI00300B02C3